MLKSVNQIAAIAVGSDTTVSTCKNPIQVIDSVCIYGKKRQAWRAKENDLNQWV